MRGDNYDGRLSGNYDGRQARLSGLIVVRSAAPTGERTRQPMAIFSPFFQGVIGAAAGGGIGTLIEQRAMGLRCRATGRVSRCTIFSLSTVFAGSLMA